MKKGIFAALLSFALAFTAMPGMGVYASVVPDEEIIPAMSSDTITGFVPREEDKIIMEYKLALFRVIEELPDTVAAYIDGSDISSSVKVSWECLDDYD
ncbi:MAG: hypothetical protein IKS84_03460, partial [Lachnospiraceae bacterium]|nr:hypothetical protein [Lachnospiraceae bacterium]MBR6485250.1 hypothetical protein [Lachnospiraceae bacterium]